MVAFLSSRFIGAIPVSIVVEEDHESVLSITKLPVEFGADITDHAYVEPATVKLKVIISSGRGGFIGSFITFAAYQALRRYQRQRTPFTLITGLDFYRNMLIENISAPRNCDNANLLEATITCRQVLIIGSGFLGSIIGAISGLQAASLVGSNILAGVTRRRASPPIRRGDNVVRTANTDDSTIDGRKNNAAVARLGI